MGWEPGQEGAGGVPGPVARDPRLAGFARDGDWDVCPPSAALAAALEGASGPEWACAGASRDELVGLLRRWAALEAWAAAGRLGVLRALIREDDQPLHGGCHGDLPDGWSKSATHEVAAALAVSVPTAENMMWLAWDLQVRLPGIAGLLADGTLACAKARAVDEAFQLLSDEDAARAEALILAELPGKNYGQVKRLAEQAAVTVDPAAAARRREDAERNKARVTMFREDSGALALSGRDLPADETLAAHARICARAQEYKESGAFPKDTRMDQFRAAAYVDLLNSISAEDRITAGALPGTGRDDNTAADLARHDPAEQDQHRSGPDDWGGDDPETGPDAGGTDGGGPSDGGRPDGGAGCPGSSCRPDAADASGPAVRAVRLQPPASSPARPPSLADLVIPLRTLLGLAGRPGESHGLGPLDPALCRALAASAAASPFSRLCVTVTDPSGIAIGHGCAKPARKPGAGRTSGVARAGALAALPARLNLTIPAASLAGLVGHGPAMRPPGAWALAQEQDVGPPGGFGSWVMTLPGGRQLTVRLEPVPAFSCDHRHESHGYQPNDTLRHLVQVRDGECTFPPCSRHARETDFEHGVPYDQGGRTCACNAGARSRQCHRVKQSRGWRVTQPKPGWHQWETPAGRVYVQGPKRYADLPSPRENGRVSRQDVAVPAAVAAAAGGRELTLVWVNDVGGLTFTFTAGTQRCFVKWAPAASGLDLAGESARMAWARQFHPVPRPLDQGHDDEGAWLVTAGLAGERASDTRWQADPATAVTAIGEGLRALHEALPVAACPFTWSAAERVADARRQEAAGVLDPAAWHPCHQALTVADALEEAAAIPPPDKVVVCHGDACAPNTLLTEGGHWSGHVDLGLLGVADPWADLAVATWSAEWNCGPGWDNLLYDAYGVRPDADRIRYYRLLWDLSS